jgi:uncharacterized membrane protein YhaH (DUF805 family)
MLTDLLVIDGRMGRARYARITLLSMMLVSFGATMLIFPWAMSLANGVELMPLGMSAFFALILLSMGLWMAVASSIRRMHDLGWSALWLTPCIVPVEFVAVPAVLVLSILLSFMRGNQGENVYGPDPLAA